jgi:hypothetical protein
MHQADVRFGSIPAVQAKPIRQPLHRISVTVLVGFQM